MLSGKLMGAEAIIINSENRMLLVKHGYGKLNWDLPGGKSEKNESAGEKCMRRPGFRWKSSSSRAFITILSMIFRNL